MATAVTPWPSTINVSNFSDYGEKADTNFAEFAPDVGPPKRRRRMSISSDTLQFTMFMTSAEVETFRTFYRTTLQDGTLPFTFPKPRTGTIEQYTFTGDAPAIKFFDYGLYQVSMTVRNVPNTSASWLPLLSNNLIPTSANSIVPDTFADFTTEGSSAPHYWYAGNQYGSFASWLAAMGGTYSRASAANYFQSGLLVSAATGVPRFPKDGSGNATGIRLCGLNIELCLWNRDLTNAAWSKTTTTAAKTQTGIDGATNSATLLTATANNAITSQSLTAASAPYIMGVWIKRITGTGTIKIAIDNGTTPNIVVPTTSWQFFQISATQTLANPIPWIELATSGDAIAVDFVSVRNQAAGTGVVPDPIATTTATVGQSYDQLSFPWSLGTTLSAFISTINQLQNNQDARLLTFNDSHNSAIFIDNVGSNHIDWLGNNIALVSTVTGTVNPLLGHKTIVAVSPSAGAILANDGTNSASSVSALLPSFTQVNIGPYTNPIADYESANGDFRQVAIWGTTQASVADLLRLTT